MNVIAAGRTFLLPPGPDVPLHLWLVLTDPDPKTSEVAAVMVVTAKDYTDPTVILKAGEHPFIKHDSSVQFGTVQLLKCSLLAREMKKGRCHLKEDLKPEVLARVRKGLLQFPFTVRALRTYCEPRFK